MSPLQFPDKSWATVLSRVRETSTGRILTNKVEPALEMGSIADRSVIIILALVAAHSGRRKKKNRRKRRTIYSKSEKNAIIDSIVHPWADEHWGFVIVDGVLHALNEQDPVESFVKFLKYSAPELLKRILKEIQ